MKLYLLCCTTLISINSAFAQAKTDSVLHWQEVFINPQLPLPSRLAAAHSFQTWLEEALESPGSFQYPPKSIHHVSVLTAPDGSFRIYTWLYAAEEGFRSGGFVQHAPKNNQIPPKVFFLDDHGLDHRSFSYKSFRDDQWPGMLYYALVPVKEKKSTYYLLLGFHPGDGAVQHKAIETLYFSINGAPRFGKKVIEHEGRLKGRLVFHYSVQAVMPLRCEEDKKRLVIAHLSPADVNLKNQFQYYGPDGSFDALVERKGIWVIEEDVDVRTNSENLGKPGEVRIMGPKIESKRSVPDSAR